MKKLIFILFLLSNLFAYSQKEANIWYFGENAGLDFNSGSPVPLLDGQLDTWEGCAVISDSDGNLLFYTDGITVWNENHFIMLNGTGLKGDSSSTQSALIVPKPDSSNIYYIFTVDDYTGYDGLQYSEVDMTLDGGLGGVTNKNILLYTPTTEKLTVVESSIANEFWLVSHKWESNEFIAFKITSSGINTTPIVSPTGTYIGDNNDNSAVGSIKISPNGTKLAVANAGQISEAQLFDFNSETGVINNPLTIIEIPYTDVYGIEFSPNSNALYVSATKQDVYQFDILAGSATDIIDSKITLSNPPTSYGEHYGQLQLATDGKIYVVAPGENYLNVINNPNEIGFGCDYQVGSISLGGRRCKLGLPPFIQSYFNISPFNFENTCFGDATKFSLNDTVDSVIWDFGDPASGSENSSTSFEPVHVFSSSGTYTVKVSATVGSETADLETEVEIYEMPTATQPQDIEICDDTSIGTVTDEKVIYDLTQQETEILNGQSNSVFKVKYYRDLAHTDKIDDPENYQNLNSTETIYNTVENINNSTCLASTSFELEVFIFPTPKIDITPLKECDNETVGSDTDGFIVFSLKSDRESEILNGQSDAVFEVKYFTNSGHTNQIFDPDNYENTNTAETIYITVENRNNSTCIASTSFDIEVYELPTITSPVELKQCDNSDINGFSFFNLTEANILISANADVETFTYFKSENGALNEDASEKINNPTNYENPSVSNSKVWARVVNANGCFRISEVDLIVSTTQIPITFQKYFYKCDDGTDTTDGIATFDFSSVTDDIYAENIFPAGQQLIIKYYESESEALAEENPIDDISNYQNSDSPIQQIFIRVDGELDNVCYGLGSHITLTVEELPIANLLDNYSECDNNDGLDDDFANFDTTNIENLLLVGQSLDSNDIDFTYFDEDGILITDFVSQFFSTKSQTIKIILSNNNSQNPQCSAETNLTFVVDESPKFNLNLTTTFEECDTDFDDEFSFDTTDLQEEILNGQTGMTVEYWDETGTQLSTPLDDPFITKTQNITVNLINPVNLACVATTTLEFIVNPKPDFSLDDNDILCLNYAPEEFSIFYPTGTDYTYEWTNETTGDIKIGSTVQIENGGTYSVVATSTELCPSEKKYITITEKEIADISTSQIEITDDSNNNIIEILTPLLGIGDYVYAVQTIDNTSEPIYQTNPIFENLDAGIYNVYVKETNGCGIVNEDVSIIGYPKYFTPNNDGTNDVWRITGVNSTFYTLSKVNIFDRYGKLLAQFDSRLQGWDGTLNGKLLPSSDYWFTVQLISVTGEVRSKKGHFSLMR